MIEVFKKIREKIVYENSYFSVLEKTFLLPSGKERSFFVQKEVDTCCVLAQTSDGLFITVEEFRVGPEKIMRELPAGRFEHENDDPDERIRKELLEETGYTGNFKKIGVLPTSPYGTRFIHCYYALNCKKIAEQQLDGTEFIALHLLSKEDMRKLLIEGNSSSCAPGLLAWEVMKQDGAF